MIKTLGLVLILLASCTHKKPSHTGHPDVEVGLELPEWIVNPEKDCRDEVELCASGEARSISDADINAHRAMLGIFETKIQSSFKTELRQWDEKNYVRTEERLNEEIESSVEGILSGAQVAKRFERDGIYFSLLKLNKKKASDQLKKDISEIDERMKSILLASQKSLYLEALTLDEKRRQLGQKLSVLYHKVPEAFYTKKDIEKLKLAKDERHEITIKIEEGNSCYIEDHLSQMGFTFVAKQVKGYLLKCWLTEKVEPLKVEGFVKYSFNLMLEAHDARGDTVGVVRSSFVATGRNRDQAFDKIRAELSDFAKESIPKLNLN